MQTSEGDSIVRGMTQPALIESGGHMDKTAHHTIAAVLKEVSE